MSRHARPGYRALRPGRRSLAGHIYLLTTVTRSRRPLFLDPPLARRTAASLADRGTWSPHRCLCWVLMPDHVHVLVQLARSESLSTLMQRVKGRSARATGQALWADGFHDRALRGHDDVRACARYVVANPVRAGLVEHVLDYPYWDAVWIGDGDMPVIPEIVASTCRD